MNFKGIELFGFKSFVDKTKINFNQGITAIVGPNGCGKSNFSDAIRWVLGEQRPSILRVGSLSDVIFNGTSLRKPLSYCEASLIFDNRTKLLPIAFEEVVIKRKAYRSGTSEFYINNQQCRLKDIHELLRDTGMGREGYSIISQGKTAEIITSKPKNRRKIFEEAAGIATFKTRKDEAEKKLATTVVNMDSLQLIVDEIAKQLKPLRKQADDALKAQEYMNQQKLIEVNQFLFQSENFNETKNKFQEEIKGFKDHLKRISDDIELNKLKQEQSTKKHSEISDLLVDLRKQQLKYAVKIEELKGATGIKAEQLKNLSNEKIRLDELVETSDINIKEITHEKITLTAQISKNTSKLKKIQNELIDKNHEYNTVQNEITKRNLDIEENRDIEIKSLSIMADIKADKGKYETELKLLKESIEEITISITKLQLERDKLTQDIKKAEEKITLGNKSIKDTLELLKNITPQHDKAIAIKEQIENILQEARVNLNSFKSNVDILEDYKNSYTGFAQSVRRLMDSAKANEYINDKIEGLVVELLTVPEEYNLAIFKALGNSIQHIVTRSREDARDIIQHMKQKSLGTCTFLPIDGVRFRYLDAEHQQFLSYKGVIGVASDLVKFDPRYEPIFVGLLGRVVICDNINTAINLSKMSGNGFKIVTLEGDSVSTSGAMSGGSSQNSGSEIMQNDKRIKALKEKIEQTKILIQNQENNLRKTISQIEITDAEISASNKFLSNKNLELVQLETHLKAMKNQLISVEGSLKINIEASESKLSRQAVISKGLEEVNKSDESLKSSQSNSASLVDDAKKEENRLKNRKDELTEIITQLKLDKNKAENIIEAGNNRISVIDKEVQNKTEIIKISKASLIQINKDIEEGRLELEKTTLTPEEKEISQGIKNKIEENEAIQKNLNQEISLSYQRSEELLKEEGTVNERLVRKESSLEKTKNDLDSITQHILEEYNLTYDQAKEFRVEDFDYVQSGQDLTNIKRSITRLGPINFQAIEQVKQQQERHDSITEQIGDLEKATNDIKNVIMELSTAMSVRFNEEFNKINENFGIVFKELFGGGKATLTLLEPEEGEDELSVGIDISAQPPGKKIQNITALSGGEQSMTAIAILFAILKVNAVPFCVLDEIDAALDESNVNLFARYLQKFSKETQFIVITHRKPTMDASNILNGVTMQERGVSTVVKVSLSEALSELAQND